MTRGTFANVRIKNLMLGGKEGGDTLLQPAGTEMSIYDAAEAYKAAARQASSSVAKTTAWAPAATGPPKALVSSA
jgi:aconitase A